MTTGAQAGNSSGCAPVSHGPSVRTMCAPTVQQFQIRAAAANTVPAARLMVDALRLSTLQNRLRCRVDKARRSVSGDPAQRSRAPHPPGVARCRPILELLGAATGRSADRL